MLDQMGIKMNFRSIASLPWEERHISSSASSILSRRMTASPTVSMICGVVNCKKRHCARTLYYRKQVFRGTSSAASSSSSCLHAFSCAQSFENYLSTPHHAKHKNGHTLNQKRSNQIHNIDRAAAAIETEAETETITATINVKVHAKILSESYWRNAAANHAQTVESLLAPGLLKYPSTSSNNDNCNENGHTAICKKKNHQQKKQKQTRQPTNQMQQHQQSTKQKSQITTGLNPQHPIYNFLIEYYGLKGIKGVRRLMRWCPPPFYNSVSSKNSSKENDVIIEDGNENDNSFTLAELDVPFHMTNDCLSTIISSLSSPSSSSSYCGEEGDGQLRNNKMVVLPAITGVFLENATLDDITNGDLHLRGATLISNLPNHRHKRQLTNGIDGNEDDRLKDKDSNNNGDSGNLSGLLYCPALYIASRDPEVLFPQEKNQHQQQRPRRAAAAFLWYRTLLLNTSRSEPILYCHGKYIIIISVIIIS